MPDRKYCMTLLNEVPLDSRPEFKARLQEQEDILNFIKSAIQKEKEKQLSAQLSVTSYDKPAWSEWQADLNGYQRALRWLEDLLSYTEV